MEIVIALIIWAAIIGIGLTIGQVLIGLLIYLVVLIVSVVTFPFVWAYEKIKESKEQ